MKEETYEETQDKENTQIDFNKESDDEGYIQLTTEEYDQVMDKIERTEKERDKFKNLFSNAREHTKKIIKPEIDETNIVSKDEAKLYARNFSDQDIEMAKKIATVQGILLMDAINDPMYISYKKVEDEKVIAQKAQVGASRRSASYEAPKTFNSKTTEEEHKRMFEELVKEN